jgi:predicted transcriptional regulator
MDQGEDKSNGRSAETKFAKAEEQGRGRSILLYNDDCILCLECGQEYRDLGVHIKAHGLTKHEYRARFNLSDSFPMIAKNTLAKRPTQDHRARTTFPKPHEIAKTQPDLERLMKHLASREKGEPAVPIDLSVTKEGYISLYDGRRIKQLSRYLDRQLRITFAQYAEEWGLPPEYPKHVRPVTNFDRFMEALRECERRRVSAKMAGKPWPPRNAEEAPQGENKKSLLERRQRRETKPWRKKAVRTRS